MKITKTVLAVLLSAMLVVPYASGAKDGHFAGFYNKYEGQGDFTALNLTPGSFGSFTRGCQRDMGQLLKSVSSIKMLVYDGNAHQAERYCNELKENFLAGWYDDLMVINDGHDNVTFKAHMKGKSVDELIMIVKEPGELVIFCLEGDIDVNRAKEFTGLVKK